MSLVVQRFFPVRLEDLKGAARKAVQTMRDWETTDLGRLLDFFADLKLHHPDQVTLREGIMPGTEAQAFFYDVRATPESKSPAASWALGLNNPNLTEPHVVMQGATPPLKGLPKVQSFYRWASAQPPNEDDAIDPLAHAAGLTIRRSKRETRVPILHPDGSISDLHVTETIQVPRTGLALMTLQDARTTGEYSVDGLTMRRQIKVEFPSTMTDTKMLEELTETPSRKVEELVDEVQQNPWAAACITRKPD